MFWDKGAYREHNHLISTTTRSMLWNWALVMMIAGLSYNEFTFIVPRPINPASLPTLTNQYSLNSGMVFNWKRHNKQIGGATISNLFETNKGVKSHDDLDVFNQRDEQDKDKATENLFV
jgi:hypothetical protein